MTLTRRSFLKALGIGAGAAAVAPLPALPATTPEPLIIGEALTPDTMVIRIGGASVVRSFIAAERICAADAVVFAPDGRVLAWRGEPVVGYALERAAENQSVSVVMP